MTRSQAKTARLATIAIAALSALARTVGAQTATKSAAECDSIVAAARADAVEVGLFASILRIDGGTIAYADAENIARALGSSFIPPRPFRLSVFSGPIRTRILRARASDTVPELQAPTVTGVYRVSVIKSGVRGMQVVRASLMPGFDSAAVQAIKTAAAMRGLLPPAGEDSMRAEVRFSSDSSTVARRITTASFPRMPVVNAMPMRDNPPPVFPEDEKGDSTVTGEVVFRFVVDRDGRPAMETVELVRGSSISFVRAALAILPQQMFVAATIRGCRVSQRVEYPFTFAAPDAGHKETVLRH
jgi:hypothetical protein